MLWSGPDDIRQRELAGFDGRESPASFRTRRQSCWSPETPRHGRSLEQPGWNLIRPPQSHIVPRKLRPPRQGCAQTDAAIVLMDKNCEFNRRIRNRAQDGVRDYTPAIEHQQRTRLPLQLVKPNSNARYVGRGKSLGNALGLETLVHGHQHSKSSSVASRTRKLSPVRVVTSMGSKVASGVMAVSSFHLP